MAVLWVRRLETLQRWVPAFKGLLGILSPIMEHGQEKGDKMQKSKTGRA